LYGEKVTAIQGFMFAQYGMMEPEIIASALQFVEVIISVAGVAGYLQAGVRVGPEMGVRPSQNLWIVLFVFVCSKST
jgi:hypothetical protein